MSRVWQKLSNDWAVFINWPTVTKPCQRFSISLFHRLMEISWPKGLNAQPTNWLPVQFIGRLSNFSGLDGGKKFSLGVRMQGEAQGPCDGWWSHKQALLSPSQNFQTIFWVQQNQSQSQSQSKLWVKGDVENEFLEMCQFLTPLAEWWQFARVGLWLFGNGHINRNIGRGWILIRRQYDSMPKQIKTPQIASRNIHAKISFLKQIKKNLTFAPFYDIVVL